MERTEVDALEFEESDLAIEAACITGQAAVCTDYTVAGYDNGDRIVPDPAHGSHRYVVCSPWPDAGYEKQFLDLTLGVGLGTILNSPLHSRRNSVDPHSDMAAYGR